MQATITARQVRATINGKRTYIPAGTYWFAHGTATLMRGKSMLTETTYDIGENWLQKMLDTR